MKKTLVLVMGFVWFSLHTWAQEPPVAALPPMPAVPAYALRLKTSVNVDILYCSPVEKGFVTEMQQNDSPDDAQRIKNFTKSYAINKNDKLSISNLYGSINFKTWDKNEIKVDAVIKAFANNDAEAQKLLNEVNVNSSKDGNEVLFNTVFADKNGSWGSGSKNGRKWRREVRVAMTVYLPSTNPLNASQQYGSITLDDYNGPTALKVQYGNLTTGNLNNANNYITVQYGKTALKNVKDAKIKIQYGGGLTIVEIDDMELQAQYTGVKIGTIKKNANIKTQYGGGLNVGYAASLNLTAQYTSVTINRLAGIFTGKLQYGKLNIMEVEAAKVVNVDADYTGVSLGFASNYSADFSVNTSYGSFKSGDNVNAKKLGDDKGYNSSKAYTGTIGRGGDAMVSVKSRYGSVSFN